MNINNQYQPGVSVIAPSIAAVSPESFVGISVRHTKELGDLTPHLPVIAPRSLNAEILSGCLFTFTSTNGSGAESRAYSGTMRPATQSC